MTRLVHISDTHNMHERLVLPDGDVLIHSGDCTTDGNEVETRRFMKWFRAQRHEHKILVPGNHDDYLESNPSVGQGDGVELLWDRGIQICGLNFYGSPYRTVPYDRIKKWRDRWSAFMITEVWAQLVWREIPDNLDVLITHQPPREILDYAPHSFEHTMKHWGSFSLLDAVMRARPRYHLFGHVHSKHGIHEGEHTTFVNGASVDDDGMAGWNPVVIDLEDKKS